MLDRSRFLAYEDKCLMDLVKKSLFEQRLKPQELDDVLEVMEHLLSSFRQGEAKTYLLFTEYVLLKNLDVALHSRKVSSHH